MLRATLPRNRVQRQNVRLHLRVRPGHGMATVTELHRHWSRPASAHRARYARPSLSRWSGSDHGWHQALKLTAHVRKQ